MSEAFSRDATSYKPGDVVADRYRIRGVLGKGGFGAVYSGEHLGTHQVVAIKMLAVDPEEVDDRVKRRFMQEARITASLGHPNTVRVFDVGQAEGGPLFLVMELLRGPTLEKVLRTLELRGEVMTELQAIDLAIPILRSLSEAHEAGLVHRDLKPANVMLTVVSGDDPVLKVLDFGLARAEDSSITGEGKSLGTPAYMSPEQCKGTEVDPRSDLYALGVILFRCVTGQLPFDATKPLAQMYMHANEPPPDPMEVAPQALHPELSRLILRALEKTQDARFKDAQELREALEVLRDEVLERRTLLEPSTSRGGLRFSPGMSLRELVEISGPLPPMLQARRGPWPDEAGPITRVQGQASESHTVQTPSLPAESAARRGWVLKAAAGVALLASALVVWWVLRPLSPTPTLPLQREPSILQRKPPALGDAKTPSKKPSTAPAFSPSSSSAAALPASVTLSVLPSVQTMGRQLAAKKVEEALTATGEARLKLLRQAVALDPDNASLRAQLAELERQDAVSRAAHASLSQAPVKVRSRRPRDRRDRTKPRRKASSKPAKPAVRRAIVSD